MNDMESIRQQVAQTVKAICNRYGLYGNVVYDTPSPIAGSNRNRLYVVAGTDPALSQDPLPKSFRPDEVLRRQERDDGLFYPKVWAFDLSANQDEMQATQELVEYCKQAEFLNRLYSEYDLPAPEKLRLSEVEQLKAYRIRIADPRSLPGMVSKARKDLKWFFKREKSSGFRRRWLDYFRSEKFPTNKGPLAKLRGYWSRHNCEVSTDQLMSRADSLKKLEMQDFEYKLFAKFIRDCYPEVTYAVGEKQVVNHGLSGNRDESDSPFGQRVTAEEYAVTRKDRFASEGWNAVSHLTPAYWEFRDVYYRAADEPLIASAYNSIVLQYAKCDSLQSLRERGPLRLQKIPAADFMNFVSLAKANKLRFYIDNLGDYAVPSLTTINVLYNEHQEPKMAGIVDRMLQDKVNHSHILDTPQHPPLQAQIQSIEEKNSGTRHKSRTIQPPTRN